MTYYFTDTTKTTEDRPTTTLPMILNKDLKNIEGQKFTLKSQNDLKQKRPMAQNRKKWDCPDQRDEKNS